MKNYTILTLTWSISRGVDTAGYNIARLDDGNTDKRYRCLGGGYDMVGTVFGEWLSDVHQDALQALSAEGVPYVGTHLKHPNLYGLFFKADGSAYCDGACGIESMIRICETIGLDVERLSNKKGHTRGFVVSVKGS